MDESPVELHAHPPERRRRQSVTLPCGCCCCCCCLHTVGGLIGAAVGSVLSVRRPTPRYLEDLYPGEDGYPIVRRRSSISAPAIYWIILGMLMCLGFVVACAVVANENPTFDPAAAFGGWLLGLALLLPGAQLLASLLAMGVAAITDWDDAAARLWAIGKITLGTLIGTGIGIGIMFLICIGFGGGW